MTARTSESIAASRCGQGCHLHPRAPEESLHVQTIGDDRRVAFLVDPEQDALAAKLIETRQEPRRIEPMGRDRRHPGKPGGLIQHGLERLCSRTTEPEQIHALGVQMVSPPQADKGLEQLLFDIVRVGDRH